jgi:hypothetical protein
MILNSTIPLLRLQIYAFLLKELCTTAKIMLPFSPKIPIFRKKMFWGIAQFKKPTYLCGGKFFHHSKYTPQ